MTSWPAKDPSATLDFVYRIPLDPGDSVANLAAVSFTRLSGTVTIQSQSLAASPNTTTDGFGQDFTVWLSGGADQETDVFKIAWTTVQSRANDDIITLAVATNQLPTLDLVGFTAPLPGHLVARYPAFSSVPFATIAFWLTDAQRFVTTAWRAKDYPVGLMALAAHNMAVAGLASNGPGVDVPAGVTDFRMGPLNISLTQQAANAKLAGDFTSTRYGVEYMTLLKANVGGPLVAPSGVPPYGVYPVGWPVGWP